MYITEQGNNQFLIYKKDIDYNEIDALICKKLDLLTAENSKIWTDLEYNRRDYTHNFFQYPAMMVPIVQKKIIEILIESIPNVKNMLDPFLGSATSFVACMENGLDCFGQDINPLSILLSKVRTGPFFIEKLKSKRIEFESNINNDSSNEIETNFKTLRKWFEVKATKELSKIVRTIRKEEDIAIRRFYWVILSETIRLNSNDRTSTFKLHARPKEEIEKRKIYPIKFFKNHLNKSIEDFAEFKKQLIEHKRIVKNVYTGRISIKLKNSKFEIYTPQNSKKYFDLIITSPPYGDNKTTVTYGQFSYLPLQWIDFEDIDKKANKEVIKTSSEIDSRSLGGKLHIISNKELEILFKISPTFKDIHDKIFLKDSTKVQKIINFFYDLNEAINNINDVLKINGYQLWTIGNRSVAGIMIPNNIIMKELIEYKGSKLIKKISREIMNKRMAVRNDKTTLITHEDILIFRKYE